MFSDIPRIIAVTLNRFFVKHCLYLFPGDCCILCGRLSGFLVQHLEKFFGPKRQKIIKIDRKIQFKI